MKIKSILAMSAALMLTAGLAHAAHMWEGDYWSKDSNAPLYNSQELSLDLFGSYINPEGRFNKLFETSIHHGVWGGGAGLNYFLTKNLGIGTDSSISDFDGNHWHFNYWLGDVYLRFPIGNTGLAPYAIGTGGRNITPSWFWAYGGGVGLEMRFTHQFGIFSDARFLWNDRETALNQLSLRAGLRVNF